MKFLPGLILLAAPAFLAAEEPKAKGKIVVEIRWLEEKPINGVTEEKGIPASEAEGDLLYPHSKPALVLTKMNVSTAKLNVIDLTKSGLGVQCMVNLHLTKDAKAKLAADAKAKGGRLLTVTVDGSHWGWRRYDPKNADSYVAEVGFIPSKAEATRLTDAFK